LRSPIAGEAMRLGPHDIKHTTLRILQQRPNARSEDHVGARDGGIVTGARDLPLLTSGAPAAEANWSSLELSLWLSDE